jgi:hypothetical protein
MKTDHRVTIFRIGKKEIKEPGDRLATEKTVPSTVLPWVNNEDRRGRVDEKENR